MVNRHFAKVADVWKHLPLAEILSIDQPRHYWETHAGSAEYPPVDDSERRYGAGHFVEAARDGGIASLPCLTVSSVVGSGLGIEDGLLLGQRGLQSSHRAPIPIRTEAASTREIRGSGKVVHLGLGHRAGDRSRDAGQLGPCVGNGTATSARRAARCYLRCYGHPHKSYL